MSITLIIGLILIGIVLILIEIFITPGFIIGVLGAICLGVGVVNTYKEFGSTSGNITLVASIVFLAVTITLAFRNGAWDRFAIEEVIDGKANNIHELSIEVGDTGKTLSALRPAGTALINNNYGIFNTNCNCSRSTPSILLLRTTRSMGYSSSIY